MDTSANERPAPSARPRHLDRQRGEGLVSFFLFLGLVAVLIGVYYAINAMASSTNVNIAEAQNALAIRTSIKNNRNANGYADTTLATLQATNGLPSSMPGYNGGTLMSSWNAPVDITTTQQSYTITYHSVPATNCQPWVNQLQLANAFVSITPCSASAATDVELTGQ